jgi:pimeloyl-ACP methyl ester carboxylesterase
MNPNKCLPLTLALLLGAATAGTAADLSYNQVTNVVYAEVHGTGLLMDVFTPREKPNGLGIVDVVSGAYSSDRAKIRDHTLALLYQIFCRHGYTVFAVRPGSKSRYTGLEMDKHVKLGIRYVKLHAAEYGINPDRLGITGASAGGHLATLAALTPEDGQPDAREKLMTFDTRVSAAGVFFPPTDFLDWGGQPADAERIGELLFLGGVKGHSEEEIKERARLLSPARLVKNPTIPFLFIHGDADPIVPLQQSQKMVEAIKAAGGQAELIVKPGGGHPWLTLPEEVQVLARWFDKQLLGASSPTNTPAGAK